MGLYVFQNILCYKFNKLLIYHINIETSKNIIESRLLIYQGYIISISMIQSTIFYYYMMGEILFFFFKGKCSREINFSLREIIRYSQCIDHGF